MSLAGTRTGRSRLVTFSTDFEFRIRGTPQGAAGPGFSIGYDFCSLLVAPYATTLSGVTTAVGYKATLSYNVTAPLFDGTYPSPTTNSVNATHTYPTPPNVDVTLTGQLHVTIRLDEFEYTPINQGQETAQGGTIGDGFLNPVFSEDQVSFSGQWDGQSSWLMEGWKIGEDVLISADIGPTHLSLDINSVPGSVFFYYNQALTAAMQGEMDQHVKFIPRMDGIPFAPENSNGIRITSSPHSTITDQIVNTEGAYVLLSRHAVPEYPHIEGNPSIDYSGGGDGALVKAPTSYEVRGRIGTFKDNLYPVNVDVTLLGANFGGDDLAAGVRGHWIGGPDFVFAGALKRYLITFVPGIGGSYTGPKNKNMGHGLQLLLSQTWLSNNETGYNIDRVIPFRGRPYDAFTISHQPEVTIDACNATTGWASSDSTIAVVSGKLRFTYGGGTNGKVTRTFSPVKPASGYRMMFLRCRTIQAGSHAFTLKITTDTGVVKTWPLTVPDGSVMSDLPVDMMIPHTWASTSDATDAELRDTRFPTPTTDARLSGVSNISTMEISGLETGIDYEFELISVATRKAKNLKPTHDRISAFRGLQRTGTLIAALTSSTGGDADTSSLAAFEYPGDTSIPTAGLRPCLVGDTDGRVSLEAEDLYRCVIGGKHSDYYASIQQLVDSVNKVVFGVARNPGWAATAMTSFPNALLNLQRRATYIFGGGAWYENGQWKYAQDLDLDGSLSPPSRVIKAQATYEAVHIYPGCGDPYYLGPGLVGDYGQITTLRAHKFLRGGVWGVVSTPGFEINKTATVKLKKTVGNVDAGSGHTDDLGEYITGSPNAFEFADLTASCEAGSHTPVTKTLVGYPRFRRQIYFVQLPVDDLWISYDVSLSLRHARAYVKDGTVWIGFANNAEADGWDDFDTGIIGSEPCIRWERDRQDQMVRLLYNASGDIKEQTTVDEGGSWTMPDTIFGSGYTKPALIVTRYLKKYYFARKSDGSLRCITYDGADVVVQSEFIVVSSGVDDDAIACDEFYTSEGVWNLRVFYRSSGQLVTVKTTDGSTFS